jgi:hypothetical protein
MRVISRIVAAAIAFLAMHAFATPQHKVATGLWIDPNESGWGLNLFHQGGAVFGSLFVYGPDGQPRWYTASNMVSTDDGPLHDHIGIGASGDLFEATGPWFGGAFDPSKVTRRKVGTISIDLGSGISGVVYTIDGVTVSKSNVIPFTFRQDNISGDYLGYRWQPPAGEFTGGPEVKDEVTMHIADNGSTITMTTIGTDPSHPGCAYSGSRSQNRDVISVSGSYTCSGTSGSWFMAVDVTPDGIVGSFSGNGISSFWGRIGGAWTRNVVDGGTGANNDLYFPPSEPGWGVNFLDQGDTGFATLFVYDPQGKSHWYSAPNLHRAGPNENDFYDYVGDLQESTGPYYGTTFNPAAVTRRSVGTLVFEPHKDGSARLTYTVDGVHVDKIVNRFAFAKNSLAGNYIGHIVSIAPAAPAEPVTMTIDDGSDQVVIDTTSSRGTCRYTSPILQKGELRELNGAFTCSDGRAGTFQMHDMIVEWSGFVGWLSSSAIPSGKIEGVRTQVN